MGEIFDGRAFSRIYLEKLKVFLKETKLEVSLTVFLIGSNPASNLYVSLKSKLAEELGINFKLIKFSQAVLEDELISTIERENKDINTNGIIVQLPLPSNFNTLKIKERIDPRKDVDGLTSLNLGKLLTLENLSFIPCTALAVLKILSDNKINTNSSTITIVGRSNLVGRPLSILLSSPPWNANVILCHSKTLDLKNYTIQADILISAVGSPNLIREDMVKKGAYLIDVGISKVEDERAFKGSKVVGDCDFEKLKLKTQLITPPVGGVGPLTVIMLLHNVIKAKIIQYNNYEYLKKLNNIMGE